jgi:hypothetical protein
VKTAVCSNQDLQPLRVPPCSTGASEALPLDSTAAWDRRARLIHALFWEVSFFGTPDNGTPRVQNYNNRSNAPKLARND